MKKALCMAALLALLYPSVLSALDNKETTGALRAEVIADEAEIYLEASQHSIVIDTIPRGTKVTLFSSGKKNKKWLYISYLSHKRGAKVTGFVDSHRVEIIKENPPEEADSPQDDPVEQLPEEKNTQPEETKTQDLEKELEELRNLLKKMETDTQERQVQQEQIQEVEDKKPEEVLNQEETAEEPDVLNEEVETQEEKKPVEPQEAAKEVLLDEPENGPLEPEAETQADEAAPIEEVQESETEETESQSVTKEEKAEDNSQNHEETEAAESAFPAEDEALEEESSTAEMEPVIELKEMPKVLLKVLVNVPRANIRLMPTTKSSIVHQARSGTELKHLARAGNWHRVNLAPGKDGIVLSGYIHKNIIDEIYETVPPPPMPEKIFEPEPEDE